MTLLVLPNLFGGPVPAVEILAGFAQLPRQAIMPPTADATLLRHLCLEDLANAFTLLVIRS